MWSRCGGRLFWLQHESPRSPPAAFSANRAPCPCRGCPKTLPRAESPVFVISFWKNSGKFSKQLVKFHNTGADTGRASFFGASWGLRGAEPPGLRDSLREQWHF